MLRDRVEPGRSASPMGDYGAVPAESVLRHRARFAGHRARSETELAGKLKSEFIANMSHALRTPLNTIIGFAKLLGEQQKRQQEAQIVEYANRIRDAATHLLAVINDILDNSKRQSGKYTVGSKEVDLAEVLQLSRAQAGGDCPRHLDGDAALPSVRGDAGKLRQVFGNLISNSIKFTPAGGSVTVAAQALADGGSACAFATGVGITKEEVPHAAQLQRAVMWQKSVGDEGFRDSIVDRWRNARRRLPTGYRAHPWLPKASTCRANVSEPPAPAVCEEGRPRSRVSHGERRDFAAAPRARHCRGTARPIRQRRARHAREIAPAPKGRLAARPRPLPPRDLNRSLLRGVPHLLAVLPHC